MDHPAQRIQHELVRRLRHRRVWEGDLLKGLRDRVETHRHPKIPRQLRHDYSYLECPLSSLRIPDILRPSISASDESQSNMYNFSPNELI